MIFSVTLFLNSETLSNHYYFMQSLLICIYSQIGKCPLWESLRRKLADNKNIVP